LPTTDNQWQTIPAKRQAPATCKEIPDNFLVLPAVEKMTMLALITQRHVLYVTNLICSIQSNCEPVNIIAPKFSKGNDDIFFDRS
jgi:hypothetical protein